jgi:hypothetical protein
MNGEKVKRLKGERVALPSTGYHPLCGQRLSALPSALRPWLEVLA